jgi:hypothetical protein
MGPIRTSGSGRSLLVVAGILFLAYAGYTLAVANDNSPPSEKSQNSLWKSVAAGGGTARSSPAYRTNGTLGQPHPVGKGTSTNYSLHAGFWGGALSPLSPVPSAGVTGLGRNYPNPFNPMTTIPFFTASDALVELAVYDIHGRRLRTLVSERFPPGHHQVVWDGKDKDGQQAASGMYFLRLRAGETTMVKKMILVK